MKKKVTFSIAGKRYEVDLDNDFAIFVMDTLNRHNITPDRDNNIPKYLIVFLQGVKTGFLDLGRDREVKVEIPGLKIWKTFRVYLG